MNEVLGRALLLVFLALVALAVGCGGGDADEPTRIAAVADEAGGGATGETVAGTNVAKPSDPGQANEISFTVDGAGFNGPDSTPAGWTRILLTNQGQLNHHMGLVRLTDGKSAEDLRSTIDADPGGRPPDWALPSGGPADVSPGLTAGVTQELAAGGYALVSYVLGEDEIARVSTEMLRPFTVTPSTDGGEEPTADVVLTIFDFGYTILNTRDLFGTATGKPIDGGARIVKVTNDATRPHEARVAEIEGGKQAKDFPDLYTMRELGGGGGAETGGGGGGLTSTAHPVIKSDGTGPGGPPPGSSIGGVMAIQPGETAYFTADFNPAWHFVYDMTEDPQLLSPYLLRPMLYEFSVR